MRSTASILHLDMDAFFASVEQRDKPSLVGKAVIVGGVGGRGVVATASYEARKFGVHSAMAGSQARRLAPNAAFLSGRFEAYRESSKVVMATLRELSPLVEPLSLDEAFVDLEAGDIDVENLDALQQVAVELRARVAERTEGLSCSVGIGSSKFMAKVASEMAKPQRGHTDQIALIAPGTEADTIAPLSARAIPGVGPVTAERLEKLGLRTIADVRAARESELVHELGHAAGASLVALSRARDDRPVVASRIAKSISVEDTFEHDLTHREECRQIVERHAGLVCGRLKKSGQFARTVTLKAKMADFTVWSRSVTLTGATDSLERISQLAVRMLDSLDLREGVRLLGVGVSNFATSAQEELFVVDDEGRLLDEPEVTEEITPIQPGPFGRRRSFDGRNWPPGVDLIHDEYGRGWVWGSGRGIVTCRFEYRGSEIGRVKSVPQDDEALHPAHPLPLAWQPPQEDVPSE